MHEIFGTSWWGFSWLRHRSPAKFAPAARYRAPRRRRL